MTGTTRPTPKTPTQKVIGLIGGMSWESTAEYYRLANELVRDRLGGLHSARLLLASVDFADIERLQAAGQWEAAGELLAEIARSLEAGGAELLLLCTNTMHKVAPAIEAATSIPFLHLADATAAAVHAAGIDTVGLLGTAFTMEQAFYSERLQRPRPAGDRAGGRRSRRGAPGDLRRALPGPGPRLLPGRGQGRHRQAGRRGRAGGHLRVHGG